MSDFEVRGADEFLRMSKALKAAGQTGLRKELHNGMKRAAKPLVKDAKDEAAKVFPKGGGLARQMAKTPFRPQVRTGAQAGVRIVAPGKSVTAKLTNATGSWRHPVFADGKKTRRQWTWVTQRGVKPHWFDDRMKAEAPTIRKELEQAMEDVAAQIVREAT